MSDIPVKQITISDQALIKMLTVALTINTTALIDAMVEIRKLRKIIKQWQKNYHFITKLNRQLSDIACHPMADPLENRARVRKAIDDINAEILLEGVDFSSIEKEFNTDE